MKESLIELIYSLDDVSYVEFCNDYGIYTENINPVDNQINEIKNFVKKLTNKEVREVKNDLINYK